ncbi:unnamed protein product, partial [Toxocara canis]|uniref:Nucleic-acid-binding protein from transposon X-element n=1 Tax=Toxocara canis TaxID=6265 RepID=A0A183U7I9_TOXCA
MEDNPKTTLKGLSLEIQRFLNIKQCSKLLGSAPSLLQPEVNAVATKKNRSHWAKQCNFTNKTCNDCKFVGHKKGCCKNFAENKRNLKNSRTTNRFDITAFTGTDVAQ